MQSYNDLSLNNSVLDKMLITPWNFNYHNDGDTWIFFFSELTLSVMLMNCDVLGWEYKACLALTQVSPVTLEQSWKLSGSWFMQLINKGT